MYPRLILLLLALPVIAPGQEILKDSLHQRAEALFSAKDYAAADSLYQVAYRIAVREERYEQAALIHYDYGLSLSKQKAYTDGRTLLENTIKQLKDELSASPELGRLYSLLGYVLQMEGKDLSALEAYEKAQQHYTSLEYYPENFLYSMNRAAQTCLRTLDYDRALRFLRAAEARDTKGSYSESTYYSYLLAYFYLENMEKALFYGNALLGLPNLGRRKTALAYHKTKDLHLHFGQYEQAKEADQWLIDYHLSEGDTAATAFPLTNLAQVALAQNDRVQAIHFYDEALRVFQPSLETKDRENAKFLAKAGQFYEAVGDRRRALELYQQAMQQVFTNFTDDSIYASPALEEVGTESWMMSTARYKGQALYQQYLETRDAKDLEAAGTSFRLFRQATENLRQTYSSDQSKIYLGQYLREDTDAAMQVFFELYQQYGRADYLPDIYTMMERSKAVALSDAVIEHKAFAFANIPDSLLQVEKSLRRGIAEAKSTFLVAGTDAKSGLQKQLDSLDREYRYLTDYIENQYPKFKSFQAGNRLLPLETIQAYLNASQGSLIEYYWGKEQVIALVISGRAIQAVELPPTQKLEAQVQSFLHFFKDRTQIENNPDTFGRLAAELYQALLPADAIQAGRPLWIIPDGPLHFMPFECLLTDKPASGIDQWPYVLKTYPIAYAYSITANFRTVSYPAARTSLAMAPVFEEQQRGLAPLKYAPQEGYALLQVFPNGSLLTGPEASRERFRTQIPQADIIHLSTHAHTEPLPQIEFFDGAFSLEQLYGLDIPAQLVVLSACETNIGTYEQGEGVMSLARSFFYAGAGSLLSSLWTVNESSTSLLMENFYRQLGKGQSTARALQAAKLDYLSNPAVSMARKSPYYWAGFVYIGPELQPRRSSLSSWSKLLIGASVLLGIGSFVWWWRRK